MDYSAKAKEIISMIRYATIATVSPDAQPWNSPVMIAYDEHYNFFWTSWSGTQHSQNICQNANIFLVLYDSTALPGESEAVYVKAKAVELIDVDEITRAALHLYERKNKPPRTAEEFVGESLRRMYKAVPEQVWISLDADVKSNFINTRREITLL